ncbi:MAG: M16 family metallopeptidase [Cyanophyceae cyanobacterium]
MQQRLKRHRPAGFPSALRWFGLMMTAALLVLCSRPSAVAGTPQSYSDLEFPPIAEIQLPEYERLELDNGMVVYLLEDRRLPLVSGSALIRAGSRLEPDNQVGLAELTGTVLRSGGTQQHAADELNQMLEQRAATVETSIGESFGSASFDALSADLETVFSLFAEVLRTPAFAPEKVELAKVQKRGEIARRNDDPGDIANREYQKVVYGESSPYARTVEYETLDNITREDLVDYYQQNFRPERMILGIVGDFDSEQMKELIEENFGDWQPAAATEAAVPAAEQNYESGVFVVNQPQLTQSHILLGHLGGQFDHPDYPVLSVLNEVLNGFGGRLFNEVRSRQGLAYSVYGVWSPRYDYPGLFIAGGQTRSDATVPFIRAVMSEIEELRTNPIEEAELERAQEAILNSFVFNFDQPSEVLERLMRYEYFGYPENFIFEYREAVQATTVADVLRAAQEHLQPEKIVTLVVGNMNEIQPPLSSLETEVTTLDVELPQSGV